ncbi:hypothetical protein FRZ06_11420 [Anoxybacterium hadale]|uniref:Uncharacterized protein n=1 Tax=Anoxybacterium hadale TaxID=3408580 RepID=A0ACD1ABT4_9FIRM|nr:hypothetical protein FRZ06_11420 [Clostridiales bacterium]
MEELFDIDKISLFIFLFIPGFVSIKVWRLLIPSERNSSQDYILDAISFSCFNFALTGWSIPLVLQSSFQENHSILTYGYIIAVLFVLPIVYPFIVKWILQLKFIKNILLNPMGKAWDYFFSLRSACYVLIHLKNGNLIGGIFADKSYASSYPFSEDIYLQEVWKVDAAGKFVSKIPDTKGIWICKDSIDYIEFFEGNRK